VRHASISLDDSIAVQYFILLVDQENNVSDAGNARVATALALCLKRTGNGRRTKQLRRFLVTIVTMYMCVCVCVCVCV